MQEKETAKIMAVLKAAYPYFYKDLSEAEIRTATSLWHSMFNDCGYQEVSHAVKVYMLTNKYPPTIADIRSTMLELSAPQAITAGEAWGEVVNAIKNFGYMRGDEAIEQMSKETAKVVKFMGWNTLCQSEDHMADRAHFLKIYGQITDRERKDSLIPLELKGEINKLLENKTLCLEG